MVRRDIQHRADHRTEGMYRLQLETAHLRHDHRLRLRLRSHASVWIADIAHHVDAFFIVLHDLAQQRCGGRLPVGPGNGKHIALSIDIGQLDFPPYRKLHLMHPFYHRQIQRHTGADHHQRKGIQLLLRKISQDDPRPSWQLLFLFLRREQSFCALQKLRPEHRPVQGSIAVIQDHLCAFTKQELPCRHTADP